MVTFVQRNTTKEKADRRINSWRQQNNNKEQKVTDLVEPFAENNQDILVCRFCPNDTRLEEFRDPGRLTTGKLFTCLKCGYIYDTALEKENLKIEDEIGTVMKSDSINTVLEFIDTSGGPQNLPDRRRKDIEPEFEEWLESQGWQIVETKTTFPGGFGG